MDHTSMHQWWQTSQMEGDSAAYLEGLYEAYLLDPSSVSPEWRTFFDGLPGVNGLPGDARSEVLNSEVKERFVNFSQTSAHYAVHCAQDATGISAEQLQKHLGAMRLVDAYRALGHLGAAVNPLVSHNTIPQELTPEYYGLSQQDLNMPFQLPGFFKSSAKTLGQVIDALKAVYLGSTGYEIQHISHSDERNWLLSRVEVDTPALSEARQHWILQRLVAADGLEKYLGMKYTGQKRFSLEGGDALIPLMDDLVTHACDLGLKELVIGMAHRGRLNVLVNLMGKSPQDLFAEFEGKHAKHLLSGDVKYHNGFSSDKQTEGGKIHLVLGFNPSHLEAVDPVVLGSVRARQDRRADRKDQAMAVLIHGDAAFAGQGVVMETLNMSLLRGYGTGGTVHVVVNNQVGFTTSNPHDARSTRYCTDLAKMIEAPILHVNGNDPEAVVNAGRIAMDYRQQFGKDVVIDLVCYRLHGHNESDEPTGTQPLMYQVIKALPAPFQVYAAMLMKQNRLTQAQLDGLVAEYRASLEKGASVGNLIPAEENKKFIVDWSPYLHQSWNQSVNTSVTLASIQALGRAMNQLPEGFVLQRQVAKAISDRLEMTEGRMPMNWGYGEIMAYATLLAEGYDIRISGEDVGRGTFSHRHAVLHDQNTDHLYLPLRHLGVPQGRCDVFDSLLSEKGVLGFEYGYAGSAPNTLVIWEAQFGDFANEAQPIIDQFITSGEEKWGRLCGLALFLPHGQEGMGAEHSSARLERFLQLCAHDNIQVCVPTTPAQHFHLIRRQMIRPYRKPLVVMTPKSLLRHPLVTSSLEDLTKGGFQTVIPEVEFSSVKNISRVLICQGKVYYDLLAKRRENGIQDIAIVRLEQLYPFPVDAFTQVLSTYAHVKDIVWVQEEPKNQGAWLSLQDELRSHLLKDQVLSYVGRQSFASPAVGYPSLFQEQQESLVREALKLPPKSA